MAMRSPSRIRQAGFSLIELMIASTIGLLLLTGLAMIFVSTSDANRELQKTAQQIENGRFAIDILYTDMRLAGFFGHLSDFGNVGTPVATPPDPCEATSATALLSATRFPIHSYPGTIHATTPAVSSAVGRFCDFHPAKESALH